MELSTWQKKETFEEALLALDDGEPLLTLRKFNNGVGVVRGPTGVLLQQIDAVDGFNGETVETGLINSTKRILSGDFLTIQQRLGIRTIEATKEFRESFMKQVRDYTDYGECDVCQKPESRTHHESANGTSLKVCARCKLKIMFTAASGAK